LNVRFPSLTTESRPAAYGQMRSFEAVRLKGCSWHCGGIGIQSARLLLKEERPCLGDARPSQFEPKRSSSVAKIKNYAPN
jgi:hypothetical protein